jgi:hypothetical protein
LPHVDIHFRRSSGRGEYEHVPQEVLLDRQIVLNTISVPGAYLTTDAWGRIRDGKPRIRRANPNNRAILNVHQLIAALALLPDPIREDHGKVILPLRDKGYVIRTITLDAEIGDGSIAVCTPQSLRILHDSDTVDLVERLTRIAALLDRTDLPAPFASIAARYRAVVLSGVPSSELRGIADQLVQWLDGHPEVAEILEAPSDHFIDIPDAGTANVIDLTQLNVDETKRRLVSHFRIDRSRIMRTAKVGLFVKEHGGIYCENCSFSFETRYGQRGRGFIEVHHVQPLAALLPNTITRLSDLMLLCSNCHRMVHREQPLLTPTALREITIQ